MNYKIISIIGLAIVATITAVLGQVVQQPERHHVCQFEISYEGEIYQLLPGEVAEYVVIEEGVSSLQSDGFYRVNPKSKKPVRAVLNIPGFSAEVVLVAKNGTIRFDLKVDAAGLAFEQFSEKAKLASSGIPANWVHENYVAVISLPVIVVSEPGVYSNNFTVISFVPSQGMKQTRLLANKEYGAKDKVIPSIYKMRSRFIGFENSWWKMELLHESGKILQSAEVLWVRPIEGGIEVKWPALVAAAAEVKDSTKEMTTMWRKETFTMQRVKAGALKTVSLQPLYASGNLGAFLKRNLGAQFQLADILYKKK